MKEKCKAEDLNSIYKDIAKLVGTENAKLIYEEYRGQQVTFPVEFFSKQHIHNRIRHEYDGNNTKSLAQKYNYSERTIRRIVKEVV